MPSVTFKQQRFFGMVRATQKGELKHPPKKVKKAAGEISPKAAKDFAAKVKKG